MIQPQYWRLRRQQRASVKLLRYTGIIDVDNDTASVLAAETATARFKLLRYTGIIDVDNDTITSYCGLAGVKLNTCAAIFPQTQLNQNWTGGGERSGSVRPVTH